MEIGIKHLLLFITIIIFVVVFYRIISSRLSIFVEGFDPEPASQSCENEYANVDSLPLKEYIIKASYNSAYDGNIKDPKNPTLALETRLAEGYRFLDLNVFSSEGKLYVGYSQDNKPTLTSTAIPFTEALDCIKKHAFTKSLLQLGDDTPLLEKVVSPAAPTGPTIRDNYVNYPLFVLIRVYRSESSKIDIVKALKEILATSSDTKYLREGQGDNELATQIDGCTPLPHLTGKMLIVMDIVNLIQIYAPEEKPTADQIPEETRNYLKHFVNIYTGGNVWRHGSQKKIQPLRISDIKEPYKTNLFNTQILFPTISDTVNADSYDVILNNSIQTILVRPDLADTNLRSYTQMFKDLKKPLICGAYAYNYIKKQEK
jgi:hypothetical protein